MNFDVLQQLAVSLALSSLIGLERERRYQQEKFSGFGGIRTFALIGLTGSLAYIISAYSSVFLPLLTGGFLALVVVGYIVSSRRGGGAGATSEVAAILVYLVGILSGMGEYLLATVVALVVLIILHFKDPLHKWAGHIRNEEMLSTIQFFIVVFVILPLLPNENYGPYGFFNPYLIWLMVALISGISFLSYIAIKIFGVKRGIFLTGFLSGLISSTALAFSFSAHSKKNPAVVFPYLLAMIVASSALFLRVLIELLVLNVALLMAVAIPLIVMGCIGMLFFWHYFRKRDRVSGSLEKDMVHVKSPFTLLPALKFGLFFAVIMFVSKFAASKWGDNGVYLTSFFSGILDVDAMVVSMANIAGRDVGFNVAGLAVLITAITNTLSKGVIFMIFGSKNVAKRLFLVLFVMVLGGIGTIFLV